MTLPNGPGADRDNYILNAARTGSMAYSLAPVHSAIPGHSGTFMVFAKAAKVDGIYVGVGAKILQQVADILGCSLLTPRLQDLMYQQAAVKILPYLHYSDAVMPHTTISVMQSTQWFQTATTAIDAAIAQAGYVAGIVQSMGKPWQLDNDLLNHPGRAENYGLYVPASKLSGRKYLGVGVEPTVSLGTTTYVLQGRGWAHGLDQSDYSELIVLASRTCIVDGVQRDLFDVMQDPTLAALVSHQGPLKLLRQPGVPVAVAGAAQTVLYEDGGDTTVLNETPQQHTNGLMASIVGVTAVVGAFAVAMKLMGRARRE